MQYKIVQIGVLRLLHPKSYNIAQIPASKLCQTPTPASKLYQTHSSKLVQTHSSKLKLQHLSSFKILHPSSFNIVQTHSSKLKLLHLSSFKILHPNSFKLKLLHSNSFQTGCIQTGCTRTLSAGLQGADPHLLLVVCFGAALANMIIASLRAAIEDKCINNHGIGVITIHMNSILFNTCLIIW